MDLIALIIIIFIGMLTIVVLGYKPISSPPKLTVDQLALLKEIGWPVPPPADDLKGRYLWWSKAKAWPTLSSKQQSRLLPLFWSLSAPECQIKALGLTQSNKRGANKTV